MKWVKCSNAHDQSKGVVVTANVLKDMLAFVVDHTCCEFGGESFKLLHGIPTGTNCGREMIDVSLKVDELLYMRRLCEARSSYDEPLNNEILEMLFAKRFVDDVFFIQLEGFNIESMLYDERGRGGLDGIYPSSLDGPEGPIMYPLKLELQGEGLDVPFLDTQLKFDPDTRLLSWSHYDKRDHIEK